MQIQVIREIGELAHYKDIWDGLLRENGNDNPYLTLEWIAVWWSFFGTGQEFYTIVLTDEDKTVGFCPLMVQKKLLHSEIKFIGHPQAGRMGFVVQRGYESSCARLIIDHLLALGGSVIISLHGMNRKDPCLAPIKDVLTGKTCFIRTLQSSIISLKMISRDEYFKSRKSHSTINKTYSREKKLEKACKLTFEGSKPDDIDTIFPLHQKRWLKKVDENGFGKGVSKEFFKHLASKVMPDSFHVKVYLMKAGQIPIGFAYGIECNGHFIFYRIAHDDDFAVYKPGMILVKKLLEECFSQGYTLFDFSMGDEPFKKYWTDEIELVDSIRFGTDTIVVSILLFAGHLKYSIRALLKKSAFLVRFKRVTLGKIRYIFSGASILSLWKGVRNLFYRENAASISYMILNALAERLSGTKCHVYELKPISPPQENRTAVLSYPASLDDLPLLSSLMNCSPGSITRRYFKGEWCLVFLKSGEPVGYTWITDMQIANGNHIFWSPAKAGDRCCHELHVFRKFNDMQIIREIFFCLSNQIVPGRRTGLSMIIRNTDRRFIHIADSLFLRCDKIPVSSPSKGVCTKSQGIQARK